MHRSTIRSFGIVVASLVLSAWPVAAGAQAAPADPLTVDQVRDEFVRHGFQVDPPITWWTNSHVTTFTVSDQPGVGGPAGRVLMVLVYPDATTAQAEFGSAQAREADASADQSAPGVGPHLLPGYGPSVLRDNVALVESTHQELARQYAAQLDRDNLSAFGAVEPVTFGAPTYAVDLDFLRVFDDGLVNL
jgi:hypothetical protein